MARKTSDLLSAFGVARDCFSSLVNAVLDAGGSDDDLRRLQREPDLCQEVARLLVQRPTRDSYRVQVASNLELVERLSVGVYSFIDPLVNPSNFMDVGAIADEVVVELFHFGRPISTSDAVVEMSHAGFRPANLAELLALGSQYPDIQRGFPVVELGTVGGWSHDGDRCVVILHYNGHQRILLTGAHRGEPWRDDCRFAGVSLA